MNSYSTLRRYAEVFCDSSAKEWTLTEEIGSGNSASVYRVVGDGRDAALKIYEPRFFHGDNETVEKRRLLAQLNLRGHGHPNLIDFLRAGEVEDTCFLLMECVPWQSLDKRLNQIDRPAVAGIIAKIASAAKFLEERDLVHRDIKPANVLVSDDCMGVKLLDLGVMRTISAEDDPAGTDQGYALPFVATAQYSSPEYLFRKGPPTPDMWKALTFYQLGAVLHDLLMNRPLFDEEVRTKNRYRVAAAVLLENPKVQASDVPPWLVALARNCLVKDDGLRLRRVRWSSFHAEHRTNINEARARLGLQRTDGGGRGDSEVRLQERLQVRLDRGQELLTEVCRHVLLEEGFPRAGVTTDATPCTRTVTSSFTPSGADRPSTELHFVMRLAMQKESYEQADVYLASFLTKCQGGLPNTTPNDHLLWNTTLDRLEGENEQLVARLTEEFIGRYAAAVDRLPVFEERNDVAIEVRPNEDGTYG